jgi:hypothetical protein
MNKNITLGIIVVIILVVGLWNPTLLETLTNHLPHKPKLKPPTPREQVEIINKQLTEWISLYKNMNNSAIGLQELNTNLILMLEQTILMTIAQPILNANAPEVHSEDIFKALMSDETIKMLTVYNGLRAMPLR